MKILIVNQPLNNRGDESAHKALVRALCKAKPNCEIEVLYPNFHNEVIKPFIVEGKNVHYISYNCRYKFFKVQLWGLYCNLLRILWMIHPNIRFIIKKYREADLIIGAPGGISMGGFQNWDHLFFLQLAKFLNKKIVYYGRSFGPFPVETWRQRVYKKQSYDILKYFAFLAIRDKITEKIADEIGLKYVSTVDTAFLGSETFDIPSEIKAQIHGDYVVFVPNLLIWHYNYKDRITKENVKQFFLRLMSLTLNKYPKCQILMLPQTYGYEESFRNDVNFFREIQNEMNDNRIIVIDDTYNSDIQQSIIRSSKFVVGARYHSIVFAINNAVPFISLSYEHKMSGMLSSLGSTNLMIDITHAMDGLQSIEENSLLFENKLEQLNSDLTETRDNAKQIAEHCFKLFCSTFLK